MTNFILKIIWKKQLFIVGYLSQLVFQERPNCITYKVIGIDSVDTLTTEKNMKVIYLYGILWNIKIVLAQKCLNGDIT